MNVTQTVIIEGGFGGQITLNKGEFIRINSPEGPQVADFWALDKNDVNKFLSTEHTRSTLEKLVPHVGDSLYSNFRKAMLTITADTSPGNHDMLMSACDPRRYELLGCSEYHRSCAENFCLAMNETGLIANELPSPFNIFQTVTVKNNEIEIVAPSYNKDQFLEMRAESDLQIIVSACPMDIALTNGSDKKPKRIILEKIVK